MLYRLHGEMDILQEFTLGNCCGVFASAHSVLLKIIYNPGSRSREPSYVGGILTGKKRWDRTYQNHMLMTMIPLSSHHSTSYLMGRLPNPPQKLHVT